MKRIFALYTKAWNKSGFTLIELLVVIAIIGVLASIVLASLNNARGKSRDARRITDVKQIQLALELYFDANNGYPDANGTCAATAYGLEDLKTGGHIPQVPRDPISDCYTYATPATPITSYHLGTILRDGTNSALTGDADFVSFGVAGWTGQLFHGLDTKTTEGGPCGTTAGVAQPGSGATERCYDVRP